MRSLQLQRQAARALRSTARASPSAPIRRIPLVPLQHTPTTPRLFHTTIPCQKQKRKGDDLSDGENVGTELGSFDVFGHMPAPSTSVDVCMYDGFALNSGVTIADGDGALLIGGEAFSWRPWELIGEKKLLNQKGQFDIPGEAFGVLDVLWPRPDLLIVGTGKEIRPLSPATRAALANMGLRVEVLDTRNAAAQFNLLATERGVSDVAAAMIPIGWQEGEGAV